MIATTRLALSSLKTESASNKRKPQGVIRALGRKRNLVSCFLRGQQVMSLQCKAAAWDKWWGWEDSNFQPNDYQLLAREVPEVSGFALRTLCLPN